MDRVLHYFQEICAIPHGSRNRRPIRDYLLAFAEEHGLDARSDEADNVVITKPAAPGYESAEPIILQGHCDMVCEKDAGVEHDFEKDPLKLVFEEDLLRADGTTLGGDDGIGVAYMLAILERGDLPAPALECVFTTDEEIGMLGAAALNMSALAGRRMLNLDSEEEGIFLAGCAGGMTCRVHLPVHREAKRRFYLRVTISGLLGGHSGTEIGKERENAALLAGRLLFALQKEYDLALAELEGGTKDNAIPREVTMRIGVEEDRAEELTRRILRLQADLRGEAPAEKDLAILCEALGEETLEALDADSLSRVIRYLRLLPNGVERRRFDNPNFVETSCNLGILKLTSDELLAVTSVRSAIESAKQTLADRIFLLAESLGGTAEVEGEYPAWEFEEHSPWRDLAVRIYRDLAGKEPAIEVIHAGLECGLFYRGLPGLSCISIGPDIFDIHTSRERLSLSSAERTFRFVLALLAGAKEM